jgi:hypothetical protein
MPLAVPASPELQTAIQRKPAHGKACNNCGACCLATLCPLGKALFLRERGPCPALLRAGASYQCGLAAHPARFVPGAVQRFGSTMLSEAARYLIGAGDGCDARFNGEPKDEAFARDLDARKQGEERLSLIAQILWGVRGLEWKR